MFKTICSTRLGPVLTAATCAVLLSACASTTPVLDASFGNAVRQARVAQTLNPEASANRDPVLGIDGKAGAAAQELYQKSFESETNKTQFFGIVSGN